MPRRRAVGKNVLHRSAPLLDRPDHSYLYLRLQTAFEATEHRFSCTSRRGPAVWPARSTM